MRAHPLALVALSLPWLLALPGTPASALPLTYHASLDGPSEFPPNASPATGFASIVLDTAAHTLDIQVTFSDLLGTDSAAHIHCCVSPQAAVPTAGVATQLPTFTGFPLGVTSGSYSHMFDLSLDTSWNPAFEAANGGTAAGAEAALAAGLAQGFAYLNIHSSMFPAGEIRGFLVPEPSTAALLGSGILALAWERRRRPSRGFRSGAADAGRGGARGGRSATAGRGSPGSSALPSSS
jgi:CHRD domain/PEP-CTERM motif